MTCKKIKMKRPNDAMTLRSAFAEFVTSQQAKGVKEVTVKTYHAHFHSASKYLDMDQSFSELTKRDLESMIVGMRNTAPRFRAHCFYSSSAPLLLDGLIIPYSRGKENDRCG